MFDLGWSEILVIAIVLIVVVGPKDLPRVLRGFGRTTTKLRSMAGDFRKQFDEALREAELDEVRGLVEDAKSFDPRREVRKHIDPIEKAGRDVRKGLDDVMKPKASPAQSQAKSEAASTAIDQRKKKGTAGVRKPAPAGKSAAKPAPAAKTAAKPAARTTKAAPRPAASKKTPAKPGTAKSSSGTKKKAGTTS